MVYRKKNLGIKLTKITINNYISGFVFTKFLIYKLFIQKRLFFIGILGARLLSQFFELIALLIPLKIILIVSANEKPLFLSYFLSFLSIEDWAWIFFGLTILLFLLSIVLEIIVKRFLDKYTLFILINKDCQNKNKAFLSENLNHLFKMCSNFVQAVIGIIFLSIVFPVAIACWIIFAGISLYLALIFIKNNETLRKLLKLMLIDKRHFIRNVTDFNFMIMFVFILTSFMIFKENQKHIFLVLVSILVARKVFQSISQGLNDFEKISKDKFII